MKRNATRRNKNFIVFTIYQLTDCHLEQTVHKICNQSQNDKIRMLAAIQIRLQNGANSIRSRLGSVNSSISIFTPDQHYTHTALPINPGLAKQAQLGIGLSKGLFQAVVLH